MEEAETGLFIGKFAPLHAGHQSVIELARDECDELIVMIYDVPDVINIPASKRAEWITSLYPDVTVEVAWTGPTSSSKSSETTEEDHEKYVKQRLSDHDFDKFYSSEFYGGHMSEALGAEDRRVDPDREEVPISATEIRDDPYSNREFLEDIVYRDVVNRVALVGPTTESLKEFVSELEGVETIGYENFDYTDDSGLVEYISKEEQVVENAEGPVVGSAVQLVRNAIEYQRGERHFSDTALSEFNRYDHIVLYQPSDADREERRRLRELADLLERFNVPYRTVSGSKDHLRLKLKPVLYRNIPSASESQSF